MTYGPVMTEAEYNTPLPQELARSYFRDVLRGIEYLNFQKIIHRDIKPSNVLLSEDGVAKIADFGVSTQLQGAPTLLRDVQGTPAFMAPELFAEVPLYDGNSADIWSLGATLFTLTVGTPPFMADTEPQLVQVSSSSAQTSGC